ncbi:hypothetical protein [Enterobacter hormaechei]|uniref:hypothetical protein n=1 Tax=Enterobacter hormaechei TaxID=158836 RepID=UPI00373FCB4C
MAPQAYLYGLPYRYFEELGVRRYGFHGTSHRYVSAQAHALLGLSPDDSGLVIAHLGNGASICAVRNGVSVDTSMGMTPLEGLVMGTRCGAMVWWKLVSNTATCCTPGNRRPAASTPLRLA